MILFPCGGRTADTSSPSRPKDSEWFQEKVWIPRGVTAIKIIFTCGGTAGHVNPALALAGLIRERQPNSEILFVGARRGIEKRT